ncbi:trehalase-like domain-containing protein [Dactylosporangium sp. NPDC049742]|uniref:trehalase-like domain-containing protein n=1 Tax=Dactylosporangium sp. NPDC049742 TaxID=3154737 RepID=UPI00343F1B0D
MDGTVDWLCVPRFDSPSIFGSLLDREAGRFRFGPYGIEHPTTRVYVPGTNVVETTWKTGTGWIVVRDALNGMSGKEGTFLICSFWLVSALAAVGETARARDLMDKLLSIGSALGLYAEEYETSTARHLGSFPQAFSHLALIEAAGRIIVAERVKEYT